MTPPPARRQCGLTLIELLVALTVFALLGTLTWRASAQLGDGAAGVAAELARWREIGRAMQRIETELLQVAAPARAPAGNAPPALELVRAADGRSAELRFTVLDAEAGGARRAGFRFADNRLEWLRWPDRSMHQPPTRVRLLDGIGALRWRVVDTDAGGNAVTAPDWPPAGRGADSLPRAVELELELPDAGTLVRFFALR